VLKVIPVKITSLLHLAAPPAASGARETTDAKSHQPAAVALVCCVYSESCRVGRAAGGSRGFRHAMASLSIKQLKAALDELKIDYSNCIEKKEFVDLYEASPASWVQNERQWLESGSQSGPSVDIDLETSLAKINNLLETLPSALEMLNSKWSDARGEKTRSQLASVKALLDESASTGAGNAHWQAKLDDYNSFAREYKKLRDVRQPGSELAWDLWIPVS
jgi:hypothetical protein